MEYFHSDQVTNKMCKFITEGNFAAVHQTSQILSTLINSNYRIGAILTKISSILGNIRDILLQPSELDSDGFLEAAGHRISLVNLLSACLQCKDGEFNEYLNRAGIIEVVIVRDMQDLFFKSPVSSFLHQAVFKFIQGAFMSGNLKEAVFAT